ncbi:hypothetical protein J8273_8686 [Carpediemonas membranifera]|uniref:Uncharacterized protein n=1 Tax=Carpediemonas membranifera TaxID=201153 RepID=A0A8J6E6W3_9EUKA|nr:hypothetical protein J8273_8686 [Carpediemonas membranifera]|eukprot:KAG9389995.1 hypothetical protein J8273_8686 [Carpediemonas membranifera]
MDSTVKGVAEILMGSLADECWVSEDAFGTIPPMARGKLFVASMRAKKAIQERESSMPLCPDYGAMLELLGSISSSRVRPGLGWAAESVLPPVLFVGMAAHLFRIDRPAVAFADVAETGLDVVVKALALAADPVIRAAGVDPTCAMVARRAAESLEALLAAAPADVRADYDAKQLAAAVAEGVSELPPLLQAEVVRVICVGPEGLGVNAVLKRAAKDTVVRLAGVGVTDTREVARHMATRFAKIRGDFRDTKTDFLLTQEIQTLADDLYVALTALTWFLTSDQTSKVCRALLKVYQQDRQLLSPLQPLFRLIDAGIKCEHAQG